MSPVTHTYAFGTIRLLPFRSSCTSRPHMTLTEHADAKWIAPPDWQSLDWAPADGPVIMNLPLIPCAKSCVRTEFVLIMSNPFRNFSYMKHRHLKHENLTLAAIDDIIARGGRFDWVKLRDATADAAVAAKVVCVCSTHASDPYAQRYHLWRHYVRPTAA